MRIPNEEQQKFMSNLRKTSAVFDEILQKDPNGMVIKFGEERDNLNNLKERNDKILRKLETGEFTVAVVGLEKAGKSTLGNALLERNILPEYTERCTYTTTKICAGPATKGTIHFYSKAEFKTDFENTLKKQLHFEQTIDFDTMDIRSFNTWWESMENKDPNTYQAHNGTTVEDVRAMLGGRTVLNQLLGQKARTFSDAEMEGEEFRRFITGINGKKDGVVIRSAHPYAVKEVIIESSNLGDMENIVLYDVPGFDSPTVLHKKQTEEMLKEADAIILVTNVGDRPNLTGTQLDMLRKGRDEDKVPLWAKTFVFGNKLDRATNEKTAKDNATALGIEVEKHKVAEKRHVLSGSAKAYLENLGIASQDERITGSVAKDILDNWGMTGDNGKYGVGELREMMEEYNDNERLDVLKTRAENTLADAKKFLNAILEKYESAEWQPIETGGELYLEMKDNLEKFIKDAFDIAKKHQTEVMETEIFSNLIREHIEEIYPTQEEGSELLADIKRSGNIHGDSTEAITRLNALFREKLYMIFLEKIVSQTAEATEKKEREIYEELNGKFLEDMGMPQGSPNEEKLRKNVEALFRELWVKNADSCRFNSLVERFTTGLLEALIMKPFANYERFEKLTTPRSLPEFLSLATYYENSPDFSENDRGDRQMEFFSEILLHENTEAAVSKDNKESLSSFFAAHKDEISLAIDLLPMGKWAKLLTKFGLNVKDMPQELGNALKSAFYRNDWASLPKANKIQVLENIISSFAKKASPTEGKTIVEKLKEMHELSKQTEIKNEQELLETLNADIKILQEFTLKAVIYAIGLERAFCSIMDKNFDLIRSSVNTDEGHKVFNKWITDNIRAIQVDRFIEIDQNNLDNQTRKNIVETVRKVVDKLDE